MTVASIFDFRFSPTATQEGIDLATRIGADMTPTAGYVGHDVVRDLADAGHVVVITRWNDRSDGEAVLGTYINDPKVARATELLGHAPQGFLGELTDNP